MITSRNSAPARPADSSPSASSGPSRSRPARPRSASVAGGLAAAPIRTITGTWNAKIACQLISWVNKPPAAGPTAIPIRPAAPHATAPFACEPRLRASNSIAPAITHAPATACTHRPAISTAIVGAIAHSSDAAAKPTTPAPHTAAAPRAPRPAARRAAGSTASASTRLNAVSTQETPSTVVSNRRSISGNASVTTEESASTSPTVPAQISSRPRCRDCGCEAVIASIQAGRGRPPGARVTLGTPAGGPLRRDRPAPYPAARGAC